jgi:hypothetical protein
MISSVTSRRQRSSRAITAEWLDAPTRGTREGASAVACQGHTMSTLQRSNRECIHLSTEHLGWWHWITSGRDSDLSVEWGR